MAVMPERRIVENVRHPSGRVKSGGSGDLPANNMVKINCPHNNRRRGGYIYGSAIATFNVLLTILGAISYATEDLLPRALSRNGRHFYVAELYSGSTFHKAADALKAIVSNAATVLHVINDKGENGWLQDRSTSLVPGDIIKLAAGDAVRQIYVSCRRGICSSLRRLVNR